MADGSGFVSLQLRLWTFLVAGLAAIALVGVSLWRLADHDLDRRINERFEFSVDDTRVSGTLWLPEVAPEAAIVFVHGD